MLTLDWRTGRVTIVQESWRTIWEAGGANLQWLSPSDEPVIHQTLFPCVSPGSTAISEPLLPLDIAKGFGMSQWHMHGGLRGAWRPMDTPNVTLCDRFLSPQLNKETSDP